MTTIKTIETMLNSIEGANWTYFESIRIYSVILNDVEGYNEQAAAELIEFCENYGETIVEGRVNYYSLENCDVCIGWTSTCN